LATPDLSCEKPGIVIRPEDGTGIRKLLSFEEKGRGDEGHVVRVEQQDLPEGAVEKSESLQLPAVQNPGWIQFTNFLRVDAGHPRGSTGAHPAGTDDDSTALPVAGSLRQLRNRGTDAVVSLSFGSTGIRVGNAGDIQDFPISYLVGGAWQIRVRIPGRLVRLRDVGHDRRPTKTTRELPDRLYVGVWCGPYHHSMTIGGVAIGKPPDALQLRTTGFEASRDRHPGA
jgi:hypothetical protein